MTVSANPPERGVLVIDLTAEVAALRSHADALRSIAEDAEVTAMHLDRLADTLQGTT